MVYTTINKVDKMKIKCIDNRYVIKYLTVNKIYTVIQENKIAYTILDDKNKIRSFSKKRFLPVK